MAEPLPLHAYSTLARQVEAVKRDGFAYFPGILSAETVAALRACMDQLQPLAENYDWDGTPTSCGFLNKAINSAFNRDALFQDCLDIPGVIELAEAIHGSDCHIIQMTAWMTGPGRPDQQLHADWLPFPLPEDVVADPRVEVPILISTAHYYLDDIYEELGPTQFIPGSHRSGRVPNQETEWQGTPAQNVICKAGDGLLFRSDVWHRGTANRSNQTRYLLQVHYANRWIAQRFAPYLHFRFDPVLLARATPRQRRLMGEHPTGAYT